MQIIASHRFSSKAISLEMSQSKTGIYLYDKWLDWTSQAMQQLATFFPDLKARKYQ